MKRQKVRQFLILVFFLLFPVVFYYLSPYLIIMSSLERTLAGDTITFFVLFLSGLYFGRLFCGWVCPVGGLQEMCFPIRRNPVSQKFNWTKYLFWIPWMGLVLWIILTKGFYTKVDFLYQTEHGISLGTSSGLVPYITYYGVILLFLVITLLTGRRGFCHYGCWVSPFMIIGRWIGNTLHLPRLQLKAKKEACTNCKVCNQKCPMSLDVNQMVQKQKMENMECILCATCIDSCPQKVIRYRWF